MLSETSNYEVGEEAREDAAKDPPHLRFLVLTLPKKRAKIWLFFGGHFGNTNPVNGIT